MRAAQFTDYGDPEVLIAVRAARMNPADYRKHAGVFRASDRSICPPGLGLEGAGVVEEVGEGVTDVVVGDAVFGLGQSLYAEYAVLDFWARKPDGPPFEEAAAAAAAAERSS